MLCVGKRRIEVVEVMCECVVVIGFWCCVEGNVEAVEYARGGGVDVGF